MIPVQRDLEQTRRTLAHWLRTRLNASSDVEMSGFSGFSEGLSGELLTFSARWAGDIGEQQQDMVVRIEPTPKYQLFLDTNFVEQYHVIDSLHRHTEVPIPQAIGIETDPAVLGDRFYVMGKSAGRTGLVHLDWMQHLGQTGRRQLWWTGLAAMAKLHRADCHALGLGFLDRRDRGEDGVAQQLAYYEDYYRWVNQGICHPIIEMVQDWLVANKPESVPGGIVWGDARRANQLFTNDLQCSAILDLEQVCFGPAEVDLAWWLRTESVMAERLGIACPGVDETVDGYAALLGRPLENFGYYLIFAAYRIAILLIKLYELREGHPDRGAKDSGDVRLGQVFAEYAY